MKKIVQLKTELKELASDIRFEKEERRKSQREGGCYYSISNSYIYRHKHIAYCMLRGKTMEQIESKHRTYGQIDPNCPDYMKDKMVNPPNMSEVNMYIKLYTEEPIVEPETK